MAGAPASLLGLGGGRRYGAEIHEMAINTAAPIPVGRSVAPFGAASELGSSSWHVLVKEPAGSAPVGNVLIPAALRDRDAAAQLQSSMTEAGVRAETAAWLTLTGDPSIRAGDTLRLTDLPDGPVALGSVKSNIGHLESAAVAGELLRLHPGNDGKRIWDACGCELPAWPAQIQVPA